jgi:hypothetical protein
MPAATNIASAVALARGGTPTLAEEQPAEQRPDKLAKSYAGGQQAEVLVVV